MERERRNSGEREEKLHAHTHPIIEYSVVIKRDKILQKNPV